jgi:hypothetical protein
LHYFVCRLLSTVRCAVCCLLYFCCLMSDVQCLLLSAICFLLSVVCCLIYQFLGFSLLRLTFAFLPALLCLACVLYP